MYYGKRLAILSYMKFCGKIYIYISISWTVHDNSIYIPFIPLIVCIQCASTIKYPSTWFLPGSFDPEQPRSDFGRPKIVRCAWGVFQPKMAQPKHPEFGCGFSNQLKITDFKFRARKITSLKSHDHLEYLFFEYSLKIPLIQCMIPYKSPVLTHTCPWIQWKWSWSRHIQVQHEIGDIQCDMSYLVGHHRPNSAAAFLDDRRVYLTDSRNTLTWENGWKHRMGMNIAAIASFQWYVFQFIVLAFRIKNHPWNGAASDEAGLSNFQLLGVQKSRLGRPIRGDREIQAWILWPSNIDNWLVISSHSKNISQLGWL